MFLTADENLENKDVLHPIQEEDDLREDREKADSCAADNDVDEDKREESGEENEKYQFPDTQIKIDLSGPK